jgi:hypothetical protein
VSANGGVFNIGSQQAGAIYQAAGDQTIGHAGGTLAMGPWGAVADLRSALETATLSGPAQSDAERTLKDVEAELQRDTPDKRRIGSHVERLVAVLGQAGALMTAGESLLAPLRTLAAWLGPAGLAALRLLS